MVQRRHTMQHKITYVCEICRKYKRRSMYSIALHKSRKKHISGQRTLDFDGGQEKKRKIDVRTYLLIWT